MQERIKGSRAGAAVGPAGEEAPGATRGRFPVAEWCQLASPLAANFGKPAEIAVYIRNLTDEDPWDSSRDRHLSKIDRLEGRSGPRRGRAAAAAAEDAPKVPAGAATPKRRNSLRGRGRSGGGASGVRPAKRSRRTATEEGLDEGDGDGDEDWVEE